MKWHLFALFPGIIGGIAAFLGFPGLFLLGLTGTFIGIVISSIIMMIQSCGLFTTIIICSFFIATIFGFSKFFM